MMKIYGLHTPMFVKVVLAAEETGTPYEVVEVDLLAGQQKLPEHLARHPFGKVPVIEHEGKFIFESNAILRYMAATSHSPLYPEATYPRALVDQWIDYFSLQAGRWCMAIWFNRFVSPKFLKQPGDAKAIADNEQMLLEAMPIIDKHLKDNHWLAGTAISLADTNAFALMNGYQDAEINMNDFPNFMRWFREYEQRPAVQRIKKWL